MWIKGVKALQDLVAEIARTKKLHMIAEMVIYQHAQQLL